MVVVPPRATLAIVLTAFCSRFAGRLNGTFRIRGVGIIVVDTKHISSPLERDNAWLHVTAHRAAVKGPELLPLIARKLGEIRHFPNASSPMSGLARSDFTAVLGRNALAKPGDCNAARPRVTWCEQEGKSRSASGSRRRSCESVDYSKTSGAGSA